MFKNVEAYMIKKKKKKKKNLQLEFFPPGKVANQRQVKKNC